MRADVPTQSDRVAAEALIRSGIQTLANGAAIHNLDEVVRRNAGRMSLDDIRSGRLSTAVLGDIIGTVEQAKGNTAVNWLAATEQQIKAYAAAHGLHGLGLQRFAGMPAARATETDAARLGGSGNRFSELDKTAMQARDVALAHNMTWVANSPELLRLGPAAVQALADVRLTKQSYDRLKTDVSFTAQDTVALAKFAKEKKVEANNLSTALADVGRGLSADEKAQLRAGMVPYLAKPADPAAEKAAGDALDAVARAHPQKKQAVERSKRLLKVQAGSELNQSKRETSSAAQRATNLDALNGVVSEAKPSHGKAATPGANRTLPPAQKSAAPPKPPAPGK